VGLANVIHARAATEFQYLFDSFRISDEVEAGRLKDGPLADIFSGLNAPGMIARLRAMTGDERIEYLDAQATRYRPGHFLTVHDDDIDGKDRLYAYVVNLTPVWRADWGGLLMFLAEDRHVAEAFTPCWNALNILKVPQKHAVSFVTPFAQGARYSITGWMRSRRP
jgi:Rps23 Pro-64 3,4-dihydroxylase Tpa1-like proline 4-hydroxylase